MTFNFDLDLASRLYCVYVYRIDWKMTRHEIRKMAIAMEM